MQAIVTKYLGPTDTRAARIKATCDAGTIVIPYQHPGGGADSHAQAAAALCRKLGWSGELICGSGDHIRGGYVFVFVTPWCRYNAATGERIDTGDYAAHAAAHGSGARGAREVVR